MFTSLRRIFKAGWLSFSRDGGSIAANIFIMVMTISAITSLFVFQDASSFLISELQGKVDISVYFRYETSEEDILELEEEIVEIPEVKGIEYVSREEAFEVFTERHQDNPALMESLEEVGVNPFLASLNIKAFKADQYQAIVEFLENPDFENMIEKVDYYQRKPVIERVFALTSNLNTSGIIFSVILAIVAVLVAFNTIRLAIYNSREEIKIQRLVGASNWFIRGPFLVQGAILGFFSALISLVLIAFVTWLLAPRAENLFYGLNLFNFFTSKFWLILIIQLFVGIGLGIVSSLIAIRRYLKV